MRCIPVRVPTLADTVSSAYPAVVDTAAPIKHAAEVLDVQLVEEHTTMPAADAVKVKL